MKAWCGEWTGISCYTTAETAGKARYRIYLSAREAGYSPRIPDIKVVRAPRYDGLDLGQTTVSYDGAEDALRFGMAQVQSNPHADRI